jgi:hypothetical protein
MITTKLDNDKWNELLNNPITKFNTEDFGVISFREEFIKSLLIDIKDLTYNKFDNLDICYRGEGRGKSKFSVQKEYVRYSLMKELGLINYEWNLKEVLYFTLSDYLKALVKYMNEPYRILILDESDELKRQNWNRPIVKSFISYLRRGRKFFKILNLNIPNLKDLPLDIITDRANKLYEICMSRDFENFNYIRGMVKMFEIPRSDGCYSFVHKGILKEEFIKNIISNLHRDKYKSFIILPNKIKCLDLRFNNVFPFDENEYENYALEKTKDYFNNSLSHGYSENEIKVLNMIFNYLGSTKQIKSIFDEDEAGRRAYYRLKDNINKISNDE